MPLLFCAFYLTAAGQGRISDSSGRHMLVIDVYQHLGKVIQNYPNFPELGMASFTEINFGYKTDGRRSWHSSYFYPEVGLSLLYSTFGNKEVLGRNISIFPNMILESRDNRYLQYEVRLGLGVAYFTTPYNRISNSENLLIGSHITEIAHFAFNLKKKISNRFEITGGLSFFHFSNGHSQLPNIGINGLCGNIGFRYFPYGKPQRMTPKDADPFSKKLRAELRFGFGVHEFGTATKPIGGAKYPIYLTTVGVSGQYSKVGRWQAGIFFNYYTGFYDYIVSQEFYESNRRIKSVVVSIFGGHEFLIGRFGFVLEFGINVYNPFVRDYYSLIMSGTRAFLKKYNSNKMGFQYYVLRDRSGKKPELFIGAYIKANFGTADFVEYAMGWRF